MISNATSKGLSETDVKKLINAGPEKVFPAAFDVYDIVRNGDSAAIIKRKSSSIFNQNRGSYNYHHFFETFIIPLATELRGKSLEVIKPWVTFLMSEHDAASLPLNTVPTFWGHLFNLTSIMD